MSKQVPMIPGTTFRKLICGGPFPYFRVYSIQFWKMYILSLAEPRCYRTEKVHNDVCCRILVTQTTPMIWIVTI